MRELRDILKVLADLRGQGEPAALATITQVKGSTYRREGARLLIRQDGTTVGSLSGGCLEGDVAEAAREVMRTGQPRMLTYDLTADDDAVWGLGLGCNGAIDVFVEPVRDEVGLDFATLLQDTIDHRRSAALATVIAAPPGPARVGSRMFVPEEGQGRGSLGDAALDARAAGVARSQLAEGRTAVVPVEVPGGRIELFVEVLTPPIPLLVCGAGHDALPLVRLAHELGWWVMVADSRPAFATRERFPEADEVHLVEDRGVPTAARIDRHTFVVVMTHNFLHDLEILRGLLATPARYIGLLGPRARTEKLLAELAKQGEILDDAQRTRLYAPVGVDTGADSPEEIALSIAAEILAVRNGRPAASLRDRRGPIHAAVPS
ncbi:MAG: XdhC/CoxI family protein [Bacillati bacterium ANGP1]|uniref:XdhC/CoxI family protein n=1 Tax=Candidatus Segetimicrobium genomatis TaxID=2569760 RepID=A0A537LX08_9BACT|nr:MAG: XdhC/CoxI family protein [Terrabacteria group bacterium ANGP1]